MTYLSRLQQSITLSLLLMFYVTSVTAANICLQDELGERIHLKVLPNGLLTGYSEYNDTVTGTAFGSYKRLSEQEVMLGGDVNNDCNSGLFPGKFNAIINVKTNNGNANGFLFICDGTVVPFHSALYPCGNTDGKPGNWGAFLEVGKD